MLLSLFSFPFYFFLPFYFIIFLILAWLKIYVQTHSSGLEDIFSVELKKWRCSPWRKPDQRHSGFHTHSRPIDLPCPLCPPCLQVMETMSVSSSSAFCAAHSLFGVCSPFMGSQDPQQTAQPKGNICRSSPFYTNPSVFLKKNKVSGLLGCAGVEQMQ